MQVHLPRFLVIAHLEEVRFLVHALWVLAGPSQQQFPKRRATEVKKKEQYDEDSRFLSITCYVPDSVLGILRTTGSPNTPVREAFFCQLNS